MVFSGKVTIDLAKPKAFYARYQDAQAHYAQNRASGVVEFRLVQFEQIGTSMRERSKYCAKRYRAYHACRVAAGNPHLKKEVQS